MYFVYTVLLAHAFVEFQLKTERYDTDRFQRGKHKHLEGIIATICSGAILV